MRLPVLIIAFMIPASNSALAEPKYTPKDGCELKIFEDAGFRGGKAILKGDVIDFGGSGDLNHMWFMPQEASDADADMHSREHGLAGMALGQRKVNDHISSYQVVTGHWLFCSSAGGPVVPGGDWCNVSHPGSHHPADQYPQWHNGPMGLANPNLADVPYVNDAISAVFCDPD